VGDQHGEQSATMLKELMHERRHLFQSAGLYDRIAWAAS
jgi:hypothetical protein